MLTKVWREVNDGEMSSNERGTGRDFFLLGNLTLAMANCWKNRDGQAWQDRVLNYDRMIALLIKRDGLYAFRSNQLIFLYSSDDFIVGSRK